MEDEAEMNLRTGARERRRADSGCAPTPRRPARSSPGDRGGGEFGASASGGRAENLTGALVKAYVNNPTINASRASVRAADEEVPKANSGYLPTIAAIGTIGVQHSNLNQIFPTTGANGQPTMSDLNFNYGAHPRSYGVQIQPEHFRRLPDDQ